MPRHRSSNRILKAKILFCSGAASILVVCNFWFRNVSKLFTFNGQQKEVDEKLKRIMSDIHESCVTYGTEENWFIDYVKGANIAGFVKVADAMLARINIIIVL
jgi:glutamate dehydrogenase (NADP+)